MAGLGTVLFQEDRPVAFASRALTETEVDTPTSSDAFRRLRL